MKRLLFGLVLLLAACNGATRSPEETVQTYLEAKVAGDAEALRPLLCSEREADLQAEARTFATVSEARIEGLMCAFDEGASTVTCEGEIVATYGTEDTSFPLTSYRVVEEDGEWRWCGAD